MRGTAARRFLLPSSRLHSLAPHLMFSQAAAENVHCQMDLVPGDVLVCRWAGEDVGQRAAEVT